MLAFLLQIFQAILLIPIEYDDLYNLIQKQNKNEKFAPIWVNQREIQLNSLALGDLIAEAWIGPEKPKHKFSDWRKRKFGWKDIEVGIVFEFKGWGYS